MKTALFKSRFAVVLSLIAVGFPLLLYPQGKYPMEPVSIEPGPRELASSRVSMVSSAHPFATDAGLEMLRRGGNAMDAAIAATMVTAVVDVGLSSFAGGGTFTYYDSKTKRTIVLNFEPNAVKEDVMPYKADRDGVTGRSIRIPGAIAGFHLAIQKYGALSWKEVLEPSIFYAENGFPLYGTAYAIMQDRYITLTMQPSGRRIFAPNGYLPPVGAIFKQPEMAATLRKIAEKGPDYFYKGPFAEQMVKAIRDIGGKATLDDFDSYRALELEPIRGTYKSYQIVGPPPPATSTVAITEGLNILENVDLKGMGHYSQSADSLQWVIETLRVMFNDARKYSGIPEFDRPLAQSLMSKEYAQAQYKLIRYKIEQMKRHARERPMQTAQQTPASDRHEEELGTNHVSAVDKDGNVCSITSTIYGGVYSYAGLFVGGIVLDSAGGFRSNPGERIISPIAPIIVFKGDKPYFATGSSGGTPNTFYTTLNVLVWDKNLKEAQEAPRFPNAGRLLDLDDNKVSIESRIDDKVAEELKKRGYQLERVGPYSFNLGGVRPLGGVQMIGIDPDSGIRYGATDPRGVGKAAGQ
ncbi:MAG: hypothetical protein DMG59_15470 [Acidobacteria bacterium]|nr:MAG: hypothetical protein DMG59_15470 [Acidobacteriota bacterium]